MKTIIVGCGRLGSDLAYQLSKSGYQVTVIDQNAANFHNLSPDFVGIKLEFDILAQGTLERAGIAEADSLAAVTPSDALNVVVALAALALAPGLRVIVRNYDTRWRPIYKALNLQGISGVGWSSQRIQEMIVTPALRPLSASRSGEPGLYQLEVPGAWQGKILAETLPDQAVQAVALTRAGQVLAVNGRLVLEAGDILYLNLSGQAGYQRLRELLDAEKEGQV